jgi:hypothetical protein
MFPARTVKGTPLLLPALVVTATFPVAAAAPMATAILVFDHNL